MSAIKLTVLGAGSVRCSVPVIASLATYFGERPIDIAFYDADEERLDLFDRFARLCFLTMKSTHGLKSSTDFREGLEEAQLVILQVGENCARREMKSAVEGLNGDSAKRLGIQKIADYLPAKSQVLDLTGLRPDLPQESSYAPDWPPPLTLEERFAVPLRILRWLNGEEYPYDIFREQEHSPLKQWLDDPLSLPIRV